MVFKVNRLLGWGFLLFGETFLQKHQNGAGEDENAPDQQQSLPIEWRSVSPFRAARRDQRILIFIGGREHAGKARARAGDSRLKGVQIGRMIVVTRAQHALRRVREW